MQSLLQRKSFHSFYKFGWGNLYIVNNIIVTSRRRDIKEKIREVMRFIVPRMMSCLPFEALRYIASR